MTTSLPTIDLIILIVYILGVAAFGAYFYRRSNSIEGFALGGRSLPGWALGLSFLGTYLSSISFLANAGKTYQGNWNPFVFSLTLPFAAIVASAVFIPFYRRGSFRTAYEHLEDRFGYWARGYSSILLILLQIGRIAVVLYLIALAMNFLLGWQGAAAADNQVMLVIVLGVITVLYTVVGGMEAVVWTDVVQTIVLTIGAIFCLILLLLDMPIPLSDAMQIAQEHHKWDFGHFDWDMVNKGFWLVFLFGITENLRNFGVDQNYVQRILAAKSDRDARLSLWIGALAYIPLSAIFFLIGTLLWLYYTQANGLPTDFPSKPDEIFPYFIVHELPVGVKGLVIAAVLAAGMSTLDSSINVCANVWVTDFYKRFKPEASEAAQLTQIRLVTIILGILGVAAGILMLGSANAALDIWWKISAALGGGMLGLFLMAIFLPNVGKAPAMAGVIVGIVVVFWGTFGRALPGPWADYSFPWHGLMVAPLATASILLVGGLSSLFWRSKKA